jgi:hypothetical protein
MKYKFLCVCSIVLISTLQALHLMYARCFDADAILPADLEIVMNVHPKAIQVCD